jgi:hypothetical protein
VKGSDVYSTVQAVVRAKNYTGSVVSGAVEAVPSPSPAPARREVILPSVAGVTTRPPAGVHYVADGSDFTFTLLPDTPLAAYLIPSVRTGRTASADDVTVTPNADGTYTVIIHNVRQSLRLDIDLPLANADVAAAKVWSYAHTLYICHG